MLFKMVALLLVLLATVNGQLSAQPEVSKQYLAVSETITVTCPTQVYKCSASSCSAAGTGSKYEAPVSFADGGLTFRCDSSLAASGVRIEVFQFMTEDAQLYPNSEPDDNKKADTSIVHKTLRREGAHAVCNATSSLLGFDMEIRKSETDGSKFSQAKDGDFVLKDATFDDIGTYRCYARNENELFAYVPIHVNGIYMLRKDRERSLRVIENKDAEIKCKFSGSPAVNITWQRKKEDEQPTDLPISQRFQADEGTLRISNVEQDDRAHYICTGSNSAGSAYHGTLLRVRPKLAPLWPFLGIVVEVIVLGLIIYFCERHRKTVATRKANNANGTDVKGTSTSGEVPRRN